MSATVYMSRAEAKSVLLEHWGPALQIAEQVKLPVHLPRWDRLRNYELEGRLDDVFGGVHVLSEWCPFDGHFTTWRSHAPAEAFELEILKLERGSMKRMPDGVRVTADGYNADYLIALLGVSLEEARKRAPAEGGAP
jgi:hypothetical protein